MKVWQNPGQNHNLHAQIECFVIIKSVCDHLVTGSFSTNLKQIQVYCDK